MVKEFIIGNVFEKIDTLKIKGKANDFPTEPTGDYVLPLLTAGVENQGLARFAKRTQCPTILSNCISVSANGANSGVVFYHPEEFAVLQDAYAIRVRNYNIPNEAIGLYLTSSLYKAIASTHDWNYKAGWNRIKEDIVSLPVKINENGSPIIDNTHFYHDEGFVPDFDYMQERIEELEQERIEELEQERIEELEQYLIATGLNDYKLTDEDIETLSLSGFGNYIESDDENAVKTCKEFMMKNLFKKIKTSYKGGGKKQDSVSKILSQDFDLPMINCKDGNNGIMYYGRRADFSVHTNVLTIIYNGPPTEGQTYWQEEIGLFTDAYIIDLCNDKVINRHLGMYLTTAINKSIHNLEKKKYSRGNKATWDNKVEYDLISLPIQTDSNNNPIIDDTCKYHPDGYIPDWDFMEKYIKAIEKIVIADVVKFKDAVIDKTRKLVNG